MELYFVRHGESTANLSGEFANTGSGHPLTAVGVRQAQTVARDLRGIAVERIYSSPLLRAEQTARILAAELVAPLETTEALREWSVGIYEGTRDPEGWELHRHVQDLWFRHGQVESRMPGGESLRDIERRFRPFIEELLSNRPGGNRSMVLVAHGGLYMAMLPVVMRNVSFALACQHGFPHTGLVEAEARPDGLYCLSWCGVKVEG